MATTIFRLAEECGRIIYGGNIPNAGKVSIYELKIAVGQAVNALLKVDYLQVNGALRETIPNGSILALYEGILVTKWNGRSAAKLPVKPLKLPRDMGVWSVFPDGQPDNEFIPIQMGQWGLLKSQPLLNDLLGQCGREVYGDQVVFTRDLTAAPTAPSTTISMRLVLMDISLYGDYDVLPVLPEQEFAIKQQVVQMYGAMIPSDKLVDQGHKEQRGVPITEQKQT